jgi:uncharacterized protein (UPF0371 family)
MDIGFDSKKYLEQQSKFILERVNNYDKLYLEFGGKLMFDMHAKRVLPGFDENAKIKLLNKLKDDAEIIICVYAGDIERNKIRGDFGITYDLEVLRMIDDLREYKLDINSVVVTRFDDQPSAIMFINKLERRGIKVYKHRHTKGYPTDVDTIVSEAGYGKNPYIETKKPIVVVTAPGPGSGKLATCLSQMYHENKMGKEAGYSKFETFPVWNVPLNHPLNIAYEAATVDLKDVNLIDSFHLDAYGEVSVNYNRDIQAFPVLRRIIEKITGEEADYKSPTDMGVNRVGFGITNDEVVQEASRQEIICRYFKTGCEYKKGYIDLETYQLSELIMEKLNLSPEDRNVVKPARKKSEKLKNESKIEKIFPAVALELEDGTIVTGKNSDTMDAASAVLLNAIKYLSNIDHDIHLISPSTLRPIIDLKDNILGDRNTELNCEEILIALSISATSNTVAKIAIEKLSKLKNCQAHSTNILSNSNEQAYRKLGIEVTSDPEYPNKSLYY